MNFLDGLLGMDDDPRKAAQRAGLLGMGATLLQAGGPSTTPTSLGQALGAGVMTGRGMAQQAYQQAGQAQADRAMQEMLGEAGGSTDPEVYRRLAMMPGIDPARANLYLRMAEQAAGKAENLGGDAANIARTMFGTADVRNLSPEQRQQVMQMAERQRMSAARAGASTVNVTPGIQVGSIPQGFYLKRNEDGTMQMAPIPGGPVDLEQQKVAEQAEMRQEQKGVTGGIVLQEIDRALDIAEGGGMFTVGRGAAIGQIDPESQASTLVNLNNTIKANIGFDKINNMREASPTGGALGNVTEREIDFLQATAGALDPKGNPEVYKDNLKRLHNIYMDSIHGTPEQIDKAVADGKISPQVAEQLKRRYPLSFQQKQRKPLNEIFGR